MGIEFKKNEKLTKIITIILAGVLIFIIAMPVKENDGMDAQNVQVSSESDTDYTGYADYYETKLKEMLEESYGVGTMQVMVRLSKDKNNTSMYKAAEEHMIVEGVLVVADVKNEKAVSDISYAICALFDLPAHKVAVMLKN